MTVQFGLAVLLAKDIRPVDIVAAT